MLKNNLKITIALLLMVVMSMGIVACSDKSEDTNVNKEQSQLENIKTSGKIVLGTSADFPPFEFHKEIDGKDTIVGFDVEIAKEIAKDLGVELVIKDMKFDGLLAALDTGNVDFVIAGMTPTEERKKSVDFSVVYYKAVQALVVNAEDAESITSLQGLKGMKIGVQKGSIQEGIAKEQVPEAKIKGLGKISDLMLELKNNKIDGLIVEKPVANAYISKNSDLTIADVDFENEDEGFAIATKKGSQDLIEAINETLEKLIAEKLIDQFVTEATEMIE